jgi:hypothetical protein
MALIHKCPVHMLLYQLLRPVTVVLGEPYSQLSPVSRVAVQGRQSTLAGTVSILCSLAGRLWAYGYTPLSGIS